jgi:hypothetical protein
LLVLLLLLLGEFSSEFLFVRNALMAWQTT